MRIIAIDPGYEKVGVAVLEKKDGKREEVLYSDCLRTSPKMRHSDRVSSIGGEIKKIIDIYKPEKMAIESLFFSTNQKTVMLVSEARGAIIYEGSKNGLEIEEFTPLQVKIAVTGYGRSEKKQVISMVEKLVSINKKIKHDDEYDAIAVGLTCFACQNSKQQK